MEASPSRSDSLSRLWLGCKAPPPSSLERLDADAGLGCSFNSSTSFIDMDPAEIFSMRWTSSARPATEEEEEEEDEEDEAEEFDFGQLACAGPQCSSPLLVGAGLPLLPSEPRNSIASYADAAFYSAQSTPVSVVSSRRVGGAKAPLLATRRILLRYMRLLAPLCRKVRALPVRALAPRSTPSRAGGAATTASPARQSTSSYVSAAEYWCQGHAETAVRDAIIYCKESVQGQDV